MVNLVLNGENVVFASKFNGSRYESDHIVANNFGYLGQLRELDYDINGMIEYDGKLYLRMGNILAEFQDGTLYPLSVEESTAILYTTAPTTTNAPSITIRSGKEVWLERLTPEICQDVQGRYWYLPADASTPQRATANSGNTRSTGKMTIKYNGTTYLIISTDSDENLCFDMPNRNVMAKSNGEIIRTNNAPADVTVTENTTTETNITIGKVATAGENANIKITMDSPVTSLVSATPGQNKQNIQTNGGNITIIAQGAGASIGQSGSNPLIIDAAGGTVQIQKSETSTVVGVNTYLILREDTKLTPANIIVDGVEYKVTGIAQNSADKVDISGDSIRAINGAKVEISTDGELYLKYLGVDDQNSTGNSGCCINSSASFQEE